MAGMQGITFNAKGRVIRATALKLTPYSKRTVPIFTGPPLPRTLILPAERRLSIKEANPHDPRTVVIVEPRSRLALRLLEGGKKVEVARFLTHAPVVWTYARRGVGIAGKVADFLSKTSTKVESLRGRFTLNGLLWGFNFAMNGHSPHITPYISTLEDTAENRRDIRNHRLADAMLFWHEKASSRENIESINAAALVLRSWVTSAPTNSSFLKKVSSYFQSQGLT
jgi:hypothetical protein